MLLQQKVLKSLSIGSIRSGGRIGRVTGIVINPHNLHIDAFSCNIIRQSKEQLVMPQDIRDLTVHGIVIDDHERLIDPESAIRLRPIMRLNFKMDGLKAYVGRRRIGVVEDFAIDTEGLFIQKIYVKPTLTKRWSVSQLSFDRRQVHEVTRSKIVFIDSSKVSVSSPARVRAEDPIPQPSLSTSFTDE